MKPLPIVRVNAGATRKRIDWDRQPLGVESDNAIARRLGCTPQAASYARRKRGIAAVSSRCQPCDPSVFAAELDGSSHDHEIAARHGLKAPQVSYARRKLGLPSGRLNWDHITVGNEPDIVIARRYGVDNKVVAQARWRRGIGKWQERRTCQCGKLFTAFKREQRYCDYHCQRYHWHLVHKRGLLPEIADLYLALRTYKLAMRHKG